LFGIAQRSEQTFRNDILLRHTRLKKSTTLHMCDIIVCLGVSAGNEAVVYHQFICWKVNCYVRTHA